MARLARAAVLAALTLAAPAFAAEPEPLSFTSGGETYVVPPDGLASVDLGEPAGLSLCLSDASRKAVADFTTAHNGDLVTVAIGKRDVFHVEIREPFAGTCISWPLHPQVAKTYRALLLGEPVAGAN